jgi:hypothetical protein
MKQHPVSQNMFMGHLKETGLARKCIAFSGDKCNTSGSVAHISINNVYLS